MANDTESIKEQLRARTAPLTFKSSDLLSTGSALLNLACTGRACGGFPKGKYIFFVGDSDSGKTWICLTCMADASQNPDFKNYVFVYDNVEDGALMSIEYFFGKALVARLRPPAKDGKGNPIYSTTVESFYYHLDDCLAKARRTGKPFIYVLDSQDSLTSHAANEKFSEQKESFEKGREQIGSYGDGKAKVHSENIRRVLIGLRETGSILIVIGQTRDNLGFGMETKTRSGGRALKFYAAVEIWSSIKEKIRRRVKGKDRQVGIVARIKIKRNRITGKDPEILVPIYDSYGLDDIGSCVSFLIEEKHWGVEKGVVSAKGFGFAGTEEELIHYIEEKHLELDLRDLVEEVWNEIEEACAIKRQPRYL